MTSVQVKLGEALLSSDFMKKVKVIQYKGMYLLTMLDAFLKEQGRFYSKGASPDILLKLCALLTF